MNQTLENQIASEVIRHTINVQRFEGEVRRRSLMELVRLDKILTGILARSPNTRLNMLLDEAKKEIVKALDAAKLQALRDMERQIVIDAKAAAASINVVIGAPIAVLPAAETLVPAVAKAATVMGKPAAA